MMKKMSILCISLRAQGLVSMIPNPFNMNILKVYTKENYRTFENKNHRKTWLKWLRVKSRYNRTQKVTISDWQVVTYA